MEEVDQQGVSVVGWPGAEPGALEVRAGCEGEQVGQQGLEAV